MTPKCLKKFLLPEISRGVTSSIDVDVNMIPALKELKLRGNS
jgi:hypothetical protein